MTPASVERPIDSTIGAIVETPLGLIGLIGLIAVDPTTPNVGDQRLARAAEERIPAPGESEG